MNLRSVLLALPCFAAILEGRVEEGGKEGGGEQAFLWGMVSLRLMERQAGLYPNSIQVALGGTYLAHCSLGFPISSAVMPPPACQGCSEEH